MKFAALMGYSRTGAKQPSLFKRPNAHVVNTFESKELQGRDLLGTQELRLRNEVEKCFFPEYGTKPLRGKDRPVYGALNVAKMTSGGAETTGGIYGKVVVVLRPHVKQNCTYSLDDSFLATRISLPKEKRAEMEETLVSAFAAKLEDPAKALAELRDPESEIHRLIDEFHLHFGPGAADIGTQRLDNLATQLRKFLNAHLKAGETELEDGDLKTYFVEHHALGKQTRARTAGYDNIENLLAQEGDFTALSMGIATLRSQQDPQSPASFTGHAYVEAQFHGPVLLDRDVEEIRIDLCEMEEHFEREFAKLPEEERNALRRKDWVQEHCQAAVDEIRQDTRNAPFKVTFYNSEETCATEGMRIETAVASMEQEAVGLMKDDFVALGRAFMGDRFAEIKDKVIRTIAPDGKRNRRIRAFVGEDLSRIPDWLMEAAKAKMEKFIGTFGTDTSVTSAETVRDFLANVLYGLLVVQASAMEYMDEKGYDDPAAREALLKEIARMEVPNGNQAWTYIDLHLAGEKALADLGAYVKESFENDVEGGAGLFQLAFNGLPPVSGTAEETLRRRIQAELRDIKTAIARETLPIMEKSTEALVKRLRKNTVQAFMEPRARITIAQTHMQFPSEAERAAFLGWATSAGKLKTTAEFDGVYGGSTELTDALEAKIKTGAPLTAQDLVDGFKAFVGTAVDYMREDAQGRDEYTPDDIASFIGRIVSVTLSRLAVRVGREGLAKIAAALDTADARWFHTALLTADTEALAAEGLPRGGNIDLARAYMLVLHQRLSAKFDLPTHPTDPPATVDYRIVPPATRALVAQINPAQARELDELHPYDPAASGARRLANIPAPANPAAMPQTKAARKQFLLRMLPTYHNHEKPSTRAPTGTAAPTPRAPSSSPSPWATSSRRRTSRST